MNLTETAIVDVTTPDWPNARKKWQPTRTNTRQLKLNSKHGSFESSPKVR